MTNSIRRSAVDSLSIAEVKRRFSELVSRASAGERFLIRRREKPLAVLISADDMERLERAALMGDHLALATHNRRHFERVPNLVIEDWLP